MMAVAMQETPTKRLALLLVADLAGSSGATRSGYLFESLARAFAAASRHCS
jgi:hypothetical protein